MQEEKKPLYTSLAAAALVLLVGFVVLSRYGGTSTVTHEPGSNGTSTVTATSTSSALPMEVVTVSSSTQTYVIRAEYPRFTSVPALTSQIDGYVRDSVAQFQKNAHDNAQARMDTLAPGESPTDFQYTLDLTWEPAQLNARYVSLALHLYAFEGGANGRQEVKTFNWDLEKNQEVTLSSLFPGDNAYLQRVSEYTRQVLRSTLGENTNEEFLTDGTKPALASFQFFTFTDQGITFIFPKYSVAPGAAGEQKVTMPRNVEGLF